MKTAMSCVSELMMLECFELSISECGCTSRQEAKIHAALNM